MNTSSGINERNDSGGTMTATLPIEARINRRELLGLPVCHRTEFMLTCHAQRVYLRLATQDDRVIGLFEMESLESSSRWGLRLTLKPGSYRYRYYADCGRVTTYVYPSEVEDRTRPMDGLDAILRVPAMVTQRENKELA
jgi:hypothetical protein